MKKRELVRYVCSGGLRMYDDECSVRWHNMPEEERADWLVFFDMVRDDSGAWTEDIIAAVMAGLCPQKKLILPYKPGGAWSADPDAPPEKVWIFRAGQGFVPSIGQVPAALAEATHYFGSYSGSYVTGGPWYCVPQEVAEERRGGWWFKRGATPVHAFKHPAHAWAFLLSHL